MPITEKYKNRSRRMDGYKLGLLHDVQKILVIAAAILIFLFFVLGVSEVDGVSMLDTFQDGETVVYTRINLQINRGDIVSVHLPSGEYYIKRVIAVGGDTVDLRDGLVYVNGEVENAAYVRTSTEPEAGAFSYPYIVPEGDIFVLGDNRAESVDSRYFGSVSLKQVRGVIHFAVGFFYLRIY